MVEQAPDPKASDADIPLTSLDIEKRIGNLVPGLKNKQWYITKSWDDDLYFGDRGDGKSSLFSKHN